VEHHDDLPTISKILVEMVLEPSEFEWKRFRGLNMQLLYFEEPGPLTTLFRTHQEYCDSHEPSAGDLRMAVGGDAYAELAMKLAQFLTLKEPFPSSKVITNFRAAQSAAWNTLTTILPKAAYLPALDSLLQDPVFAEPRKYSAYTSKKELEDTMLASLEYLKV
jgi:hypothetical protein